jgi:hypothetical protein
VQAITGLTGPVDIALDANSIYFIDNKTVWQASKTTLAKKRIGAANENGPQQLAVGNGYVYWTNKSGVRAVPIGGGSVKTLYPGSSLTAIAVDATDVYWSDASQILKAPVSGSGTPTPFAAFPATPPMRIDATNLYVLGNSGLPSPNDGITVPIAVNKSTGAQDVFQQGSVDGSLTWLTLAINSDSLFSTMLDTSFAPTAWTITAQSKSGTGYPPTPPASFDFVNALAADDCTLFVAGSYGGQPGIFSVLVNDAYFQVTTVTSNITSSNGASGIAVDDSYVYWLDSTFIGRIAR